MQASSITPLTQIPVGTQVVITGDFTLPGGAFKKSGSVGEVLQFVQDQGYQIRFADGAELWAQRKDLAIRRSDAPELVLPKRDVREFEPYLVYRVRMGSRAFGLADEKSDIDERGVYLPPAAWHWSLLQVPDQIEFKILPDGTRIDHNRPEKGDDICWWELEKFLRLALKANPNLLEALYVPDQHVLHADRIGNQLRELRPKFLSKYVYQTYSGYVLSQFRKMRKDIEHGGMHRPKHAMHLIRLLYSGIEALRGNGIMVDVGGYREELLKIKHENIPFETIYKRALELDQLFQAEYQRTTLPDLPDVEAVDRFLVEARRSRV